MLPCGQGHDRLINCVPAAMGKSVSGPKPSVAAIAIYQHKICGAQHISKHVRGCVLRFAGYFQCMLME